MAVVMAVAVAVAVVVAGLLQQVHLLVPHEHGRVCGHMGGHVAGSSRTQRSGGAQRRVVVVVAGFRNSGGGSGSGSGSGNGRGSTLVCLVTPVERTGMNTVM